MFTRTFAALVIAAAIATPAFASAQSARVSDVDYLKLSRCAAYSTLPAMPDEKGEALAARVKEQARGRSAVIVTRADDEAKEIRRSNRKVAFVEAFNAKKEAACAGL